MKIENNEFGSVPADFPVHDTNGIVPTLSWRLRPWHVIRSFALALSRMLGHILLMFKGANSDNLFSYLPKRDKIVEGILFMLEHAQNHGAVVKTSTLASAMFLADKEHMDAWQRPVFFDNYVATAGGPIGVATREMLDPAFDWASLEFDAAPWTLGVDDRGNPIFTGTQRGPNLQRLSESDIEVLSSVLATIVAVSPKQLEHLTRHSQAYIAAWRNGEGDGAAIDPRLVPEVRDDELIDELLYASRHPL